MATVPNIVSLYYGIKTWIAAPMKIHTFTTSSALLLFCLFVSMLLSACGTLPDKKPVPMVNAQPVNPHKIAIVNASRNVINTVAYKPCGSSNNYQTLTNMLHPNEKLSITIYSQCVDLMATNAFRKKLVDAKNVDLKKTKTWTIK